MSAVLALGRWLGIGLAGLVNTFDPQVVVLGGLFGRLAPLVHEPMDAELAARVMSVSRDPVRVVASASGMTRRSWAPRSGRSSPSSRTPCAGRPGRSLLQGGAMANV